MSSEWEENFPDVVEEALLTVAETVCALWALDLDTFYRIAHYCFPKLPVLPRKTFQPLKTFSSLQALAGFCWSLTWLFKAVYILVAHPQIDTAC